jgi:hypothetical protein
MPCEPGEPGRPLTQLFGTRRKGAGPIGSRPTGWRRSPRWHGMPALVPGHVRVGGAPLAAGQGAYEAKGRGVVVAARVRVVDGQREAEAHDERAVDSDLLQENKVVEEQARLAGLIARVNPPEPGPDKPADAGQAEQGVARLDLVRVSGEQTGEVIGVAAGGEAELSSDDLPPAASQCAAGRFGSIDMLESAPSGRDRLTRRMPVRATNARCIGCNGRRPDDAQKEHSLSATPLLSWKSSVRAAPESAAAASGAAAFADVAAACGAHFGAAGEAERGVGGSPLLRFDQLGGAVRLGR